MKLFELVKDGGPESTVWAYVLIEWKSVFSVMLLHFKNGSREAFHSHAFHCLSWLLRGGLIESKKNPDGSVSLAIFRPSIFPILTTRENFHKVQSSGDSWAITFRGPWSDHWFEEADGETYRLTNGRVKA